MSECLPGSWAVGGLAVMKARADTTDVAAGTATVVRRNENMGNLPEVFFAAQIGTAAEDHDVAVKNRCFFDVSCEPDTVAVTCQ